MSLFKLNQTFLRQKVTLGSCPTSPRVNGEHSDFDMKVKEKLISSSDKSLQVENRDELRSSTEVDMLPSMRSIDPSGSFEGRSGSDLVYSMGTQDGGRMGISSFLHEEGCHSIESSRTLERGSWGDECHDNDRKFIHGCSKANENTTSAGALRYALHLRFLCPSKKCSRSFQRCKSDPLSVPQRTCMDIERERRFYLHNDLRVVFPQRHSDSDEGKVCSSSFIYHMVLCCFAYMAQNLHLIVMMLMPQTGNAKCCNLKCIFRFHILIILSNFIFSLFIA